MFTGFLFGAHKLQTLMIGSIFLLDIVSFERKNNAEKGLEFGKKLLAVKFFLNHFKHHPLTST